MDGIAIAESLLYKDTDDLKKCANGLVTDYTYALMLAQKAVPLSHEQLRNHQKVLSHHNNNNNLIKTDNMSHGTSLLDMYPHTTLNTSYKRVTELSNQSLENSTPYIDIWEDQNSVANLNDYVNQLIYSDDNNKCSETTTVSNSFENERENQMKKCNTAKCTGEALLASDKARDQDKSTLSMNYQKQTSFPKIDWADLPDTPKIISGPVQSASLGLTSKEESHQPKHTTQNSKLHVTSTGEPISVYQNQKLCQIPSTITQAQYSSVVGPQSNPNYIIMHGTNQVIIPGHAIVPLPSRNNQKAAKKNGCPEFQGKFDLLIEVHQLLENEKREVENTLMELHPGKKFGQISNSIAMKIAVNGSRFDKELNAILLSHNKMMGLISKMEKLRIDCFPSSVHSTLDCWLEGIRKCQARRKEEVINATNRQRSGTTRHQDEKDMLALVAALKELIEHIRKVRTILWATLQMTTQKERTHSAASQTFIRLQQVSKVNWIRQKSLSQLRNCSHRLNTAAPQRMVNGVPPSSKCSMQPTLVLNPNLVASHSKLSEGSGSSVFQRNNEYVISMNAMSNPTSAHKDIHSVQSAQPLSQQSIMASQRQPVANAAAPNVRSNNFVPVNSTMSLSNFPLATFQCPKSMTEGASGVLGSCSSITTSVHLLRSGQSSLSGGINSCTPPGCIVYSDAHQHANQAYTSTQARLPVQQVWNYCTVNGNRVLAQPANTMQVSPSRQAAPGSMQGTRNLSVGMYPTLQPAAIYPTFGNMIAFRQAPALLPSAAVSNSPLAAVPTNSYLAGCTAVNTASLNNSSSVPISHPSLASTTLRISNMPHLGAANCLPSVGKYVLRNGAIAPALPCTPIQLHPAATPATPFGMCYPMPIHSLVAAPRVA